MYQPILSTRAAYLLKTASLSDLEFLAKVALERNRLEAAFFKADIIPAIGITKITGKSSTDRIVREALYSVTASCFSIPATHKTGQGRRRKFWAAEGIEPDQDQYPGWRWEDREQDEVGGLQPWEETP